MSNLVRCEACDETFKIKQIKKQNVGMDKGERVVFQYFECPHCKKKYRSHVESPKIRRLIKKVSALQQNISLVAKSKLDHDEKVKQMQENKDKIKQLQEEAREVQEDLKARFTLK